MIEGRVSYHEVLQLVERLTPLEQAQLLDELRARLLGFGMWREREEMKDVESYVEELRAEEGRHPGGQAKTAEEFRRELESWDG
ncbi:MAG: hypothetical protein ACUVX8_18340 [Candidatus Zipacnadales bacterium]